MDVVQTCMRVDNFSEPLWKSCAGKHIVRICDGEFIQS